MYPPENPLGLLECAYLLLVSDMEKVSGKRNETGWIELGPDSTVSESWIIAKIETEWRNIMINSLLDFSDKDKLDITNDFEVFVYSTGTAGKTHFQI